jgi:hypothetical protein
MSRAITDYLDRVMVYANRNQQDTINIRTELEDHILKKISTFEAKGLPREDAIFQALKEYGHPRIVGYGLRPRFPLIDIRAQGTARGFIAIGPRAVGVVAFGGAACGVFAFGGFSAGIFTMGGFALSLIFAFGGFALAPLGIAYGGFAAGLLAFGGFAVGICASGGMGIGLWVAQAGHAISHFPASETPAFFSTVSNLMMRHQWIVQVVFFAAFFPLLFAGMWLQSKEMKRIQAADPSFADC